MVIVIFTLFLVMETILRVHLLRIVFYVMILCSMFMIRNFVINLIVLLLL